MRRRMARSALVILLGFLTPLLTLVLWWSWSRSADLVLAQSRQSLDFQARLASNRLADFLHDTIGEVEYLARHPVVSSAMADGASAAKTLLEGILTAQKSSTGQTITVVRRDGTMIWTSPGSLTDHHPTTEVTEAVHGHETQTARHGSLFVITTPVHDPQTKAVVGAVIVHQALEPLLYLAGQGLTATLRLEDPQEMVVGSPPTDEALEAGHDLHHLHLNALGLRVVASQPMADLEAPVNGQIRDYVVAEISILALAAAGAVLVVRRLTRRLECLATAARTTRDPSAVPDLGEDEVGDLARTLRALLTDVAQARDHLEAQVALRTTQLNEALLLGRMGAWSFEVEEGMFTFNDEFYAIFGTTAGEEGGYRMRPDAYATRFIPESHRHLVAHHIREVLDSTSEQRIWALDHPIIRADGSQGMIDVRFRTVRDAGGQVVQMVGVNQDITERKTLELDLARSRDAAQAASRSKSSFLAVMSHEIRTPLNGVIGMSQLLDGTTLTPDQREMVLTITSSGRHLLTVINDILDFSKIEAGRFALEAQPFRPGAVVEEVIRLLGPAAQAKHLDLTSTIDPAMPVRVLGDAARLRQILTNLIGNAVKFTERGFVRVQVTAHPGNPGQVALVLRIEDSGIGIRPDRLADLFHPFVQEDVSTTRRYGGTGLGLAISRRLAELMDGTITVDSTYGRGTVFTVQVLLGSCDGDITPSPTPLPAMGRLGIILLVEDHPVNQRVATLLLQRLGHRVLVAEDGQVALTVLSRERVDLVLMDCQMPVMDGFTATRRLRDPTSTVLDHHVPVIALTANALQGDREACLAAGMDDFLPKPLEATALLAILARWMGPQPRV